MKTTLFLIGTLFLLAGCVLPSGNEKGQVKSDQHQIREVITLDWFKELGVDVANQTIYVDRLAITSRTIMENRPEGVRLRPIPKGFGSGPGPSLNVFLIRLEGSSAYAQAHWVNGKGTSAEMSPDGAAGLIFKYHLIRRPDRWLLMDKEIDAFTHAFR